MSDDDGESAAVDLVEQVQGARCINAMSSVCLLSSQQGGISWPPTDGEDYPNQNNNDEYYNDDQH